jgi:hypothetical protein
MFVLDGNGASYDGAGGLSRFNGQLAADHGRPVLHDPHPQAVFALGRDAYAVVLDSQDDVGVIQVEAHTNILCACVLQRVGTCFLGNMVELCGRQIVMDASGFVVVIRPIDFRFLRQSRRQFLERAG